KSDHKLVRARSSTLRLSPVLRFRRCRCLPLHVAGSVGSTALQRLYVVDDVPRTSARGLARRGTRMLLLEAADCSPRTPLEPSVRKRADALARQTAFESNLCPASGPRYLPTRSINRCQRKKS